MVAIHRTNQRTDLFKNLLFLLFSLCFAVPEAQLFSGHLTSHGTVKNHRTGDRIEATFARQITRDQITSAAIR